MLKSFQKVARLHRRITVTVPVPPAIARENLSAALAAPILLSGKYQVTRRYWGNLSHNQLRFHGPKDRYSRQICFVVEGMMTGCDAESASGGASSTLFQGDLYVSRVNVVQTLAAIIVIFTVLGVLMWWSAIPVGLVVTGFIYGMMQWHCQCYSKEITQLLADLMLKGAPPFQS